MLCFDQPYDLLLFRLYCVMEMDGCDCHTLRVSEDTNISFVSSNNLRCYSHGFIQWWTSIYIVRLVRYFNNIDWVSIMKNRHGKSGHMSMLNTYWTRFVRDACLIHTIHRFGMSALRSIWNIHVRFVANEIRAMTHGLLHIIPNVIWNILVIVKFGWHLDIIK